MGDIKPQIREILGEMMTYEPFDKIAMPSELLEKITEKIYELSEREKQNTTEEMKNELVAIITNL